MKHHRESESIVVFPSPGGEGWEKVSFQSLNLRFNASIEMSRAGPTSVWDVRIDDEEPWEQFSDRGTVKLIRILSHLRIFSAT